MSNNKDINNLCSLRIKEALNDNSLKAIELAEKSGLAKATISHYVTGTRVPSRENAASIGKVLGVNPAWLMGFDTPKYLDNSDKRSSELLLSFYSQLSPEQQDVVMNLIKTMI